MGSKISIIIPAFNEEKCIVQTVGELRNFFKGPNYEIIISADGCTDRTPDIVKHISKMDNRVKLVNTGERLGKGGGLKKGFYVSKGDIVVFADADRSCSPTEIGKLINLLKNFDIVIASRAVDRKKILKQQSLIRDYMGRAFNLLLRFLLGLNIKDTQCGYKVFRRNVLSELISEVKSNGWEFDTELLFKAAKRKIRIYECAVEWRNRDDSRLSIFPDSLKMLFGLVRIRFSS